MLTKKQRREELEYQRKHKINPNKTGKPHKKTKVMALGRKHVKVMRGNGKGRTPGGINNRAFRRCAVRAWIKEHGILKDGKKITAAKNRWTVYCWSWVRSKSDLYGFGGLIEMYMKKAMKAQAEWLDRQILGDYANATTPLSIHNMHQATSNALPAHDPAWAESLKDFPMPWLYGSPPEGLGGRGSAGTPAAPKADDKPELRADSLPDVQEGGFDAGSGI